VLHAFAVGVCIGELEGVESSEPVEKSNGLIGLGSKQGR
jgi:hypothetical protein